MLENLYIYTNNSNSKSKKDLFRRKTKGEYENVSRTSNIFKIEDSAFTSILKYNIFDFLSYKSKNFFEKAEDYDLVPANEVVVGNYILANEKFVPVLSIKGNTQDIIIISDRFSYSKDSLLLIQKHKSFTPLTLNTTKETSMKETNMTAVKSASQIVAGKALNKQAQKRLKKVVPLVAKGYVKNPLVTVALANAVIYGVDKFFPDNDKAKWAANAMLAASMAELMTSFDFEGILKDFLKNTSTND